MGKPIDQPVSELLALLQEQLAAHDGLLALLKQKQRALASADRGQVAALAQQENQRLQAIADLEKKRLTVVGRITLLLDPQAGQPLRLAELAERLSEPTRGKLLVLRTQLRQRMEQVQHESGVARRAADSLLRHVQGLMQSISGTLTDVATYTRQGSRPATALRVSTFTATA